MAGISHVFTITRVAEMLGEDEDLLQEISIDMDPEDGRLTVLGPGEESITAFTPYGVDNLTELVKMVKADSQSGAEGGRDRRGGDCDAVRREGRCSLDV